MFPIFLTQTIQVNQEDKHFSKQLCEGDKLALSKFQELFSDELFYIANKFIYSIREKINYSEAWPYRNKKGYTIYVDDDVAETYVWLLELSRKKSCKYKGINGSTFSTYIISVLNHKWTSVDHFRWYKRKQSREIDDKHEIPTFEKDREFGDPGELIDFEIVRDKFTKVIDTLTDAESRFLSIYYFKNAKQVYESISKFSDYMEELNISNIKDIYAVYTRLQIKVVNNFEELFPNEFVEYEINRKKIKNSLKIYYYYLKKDKKRTSND